MIQLCLAFGAAQEAQAEYRSLWEETRLMGLIHTENEHPQNQNREPEEAKTVRRAVKTGQSSLRLIPLLLHRIIWVLQ